MDDTAAVDLVRANSTLCLNVDNPGWDDARGYWFDEARSTLYFPVSKKYLADRDLAQYRVLIWCQPRVVVEGELMPATSETDTAVRLELAAAAGVADDDARLIILDQRTRRARRTSYKLQIRTATIVDT